MASKKLTSYIKDQFAKGYDINTIKYQLIKTGYTTEQVNEAIRQSYGQKEVKHIIHFSPATMITILSIFLGLVAVSAVFFFMMKPDAPSQLLDMEIEAITSTAKQGGEVSFTVQLTSMGTKKRYDVNLKYELINKKTNKVVTFEEETKAIETSASLRKDMEIPSETLPGDYLLRAIAAYDSQRAVATLQIKIETAGTAVRECEEDSYLDCGDGISITEYLCVEGEKVYSDEQCPGKECGEKTAKPCEEAEWINYPTCDWSTVPCDAEPVTPGQINLDNSFEALEKIKELAKQNPAEAAAYCPKFRFQTSKDVCYEYVGEEAADTGYCEIIQDERTKDICYANVARKMDMPKVCERIKKDNRRDSCYMSFVIEGKRDFSVCEKVVNEYLKQSCNSLKQLSDINATQLSFYQDLISQSLASLSIDEEALKETLAELGFD